MLHVAVNVADALCPPEAPTAAVADLDWRLAHLAGEALLEIGLKEVESSSRYVSILDRVRSWLVALIQKGALAPKERALAGATLGKLGDPREAAWSAPAEETEEEAVARPGVEYTWKTPLCGCDDPQKGFQVVETLRRAGIESWIDRASRFTPLGDSDTGQCILVAADQMDHARAVLAQPIPKDIVELSEMSAPEFEVPVCPQCGAADPILESVEPVNAWSCDTCGAEWEDEAEEEHSEA